MDDILGQGGDKPPSPWPRRLAAVVVLVAATVLIVTHLPRHPGRPGGAAHPAQAGRPGAAPLTASGSGPLAPGLASEPSGVSGPTLPWDQTARLPVTGVQPAWFWPATGRLKPIGGLPRDPAGYQFIRVTGGWAVQANLTGPAAQAGCGNCAGPSLPVYFLGAGAQSVTQVGLADDVAPGADADTVWLTTYPPGADLSRAAGLAREVSATGVPRGPQLSLPAGYVIAQGTDRGLLLAPATQRPGATADLLWNPAAPQAGRAYDAVIAASASEIAWVARCSPLCQVQVLNLATGRRSAIDLPGASSAANGAFSPDGHFLALEVSFTNGGDAGALALQLDVASTASGRLTVVPGTWVSSDALVGFGWPAAGDTLIAELSFTTRLQVASWQPGAAHLAIAANKPGPTSGSLIVS